MSRRWIGAAIGAVALLAASSAQAKDDDWTGFYLGGNAGGSNDNIKTDDSLFITQISNLQVTGRGLVVVPGTTLPLHTSDHKTNFDWGGQVGFQWQTGRFVIGAEGDYDPSHRDVSASQSQSLPPTALTPSTTIDSIRNVRIDRVWSIRARAGYAFGRTLVYATGGYASARLSAFAVDTFTNPGGPAASCAPAPCQANLGPEGPNVTTSSNARDTVGGWRAGLGLDQRLGRHFSIGLEYLHTDFGGHDLTYHSSVTSFGGTFTRGDNGATGTHGQVVTAASRVATTTDALLLRLNFRL